MVRLIMGEDAENLGRELSSEEGDEYARSDRSAEQII
jgi:hypothetical protein